MVLAGGQAGGHRRWKSRGDMSGAPTGVPDGAEVHSSLQGHHRLAFPGPLSLLLLTFPSAGLPSPSPVPVHIIWKKVILAPPCRLLSFRVNTLPGPGQ